MKNTELSINENKIAYLQHERESIMEEADKLFDIVDELDARIRSLDHDPIDPLDKLDYLRSMIEIAKEHMYVMEKLSEMSERIDEIDEELNCLK